MGEPETEMAHSDVPEGNIPERDQEEAATNDNSTNKENTNSKNKVTVGEHVARDSASGDKPENDTSKSTIAENQRLHSQQIHRLTSRGTTRTTSGHIRRTTNASTGASTLKAELRKRKLEIGNIFYNGNFFQLHDAKSLKAHDSRGWLIVKVIHKSNIENWRLDDLKTFYETHKQKRQTALWAATIDVIEDVKTFAVIQSYISMPLYEEWMTIKHENQTCLARTEKYLAKWFTQSIKIFEKLSQEHMVFEYISPFHTFFTNEKGQLIVGDFYCASFMKHRAKIWIRSRNANFDVTLQPPEAARLAMDQSAFCDLENFVPGSIYLAGALLYFFVTGTKPSYRDGKDDTKILRQPPILKKQTKDFRTFLVSTLEVETEMRPLSFDMAIEDKWVTKNYGFKACKSAHQMRDEYITTIRQFHGQKKSQDKNSLPDSIDSRILLARQVPFTFRKDLYLKSEEDFEKENARLKTANFETALLKESFNGLVYPNPSNTDPEMPKRFGIAYDTRPTGKPQEPKRENSDSDFTNMEESGTR